MLKTARFRVREDELDKALHPQRMAALWKKHIRSVLRDQPVKDLHDYYDFHINLEYRIIAIRSAIFQGIYQPLRPIRVRSEKKYGITRQLVILNPDDALVFETIGDYLVPIIEKNQPSAKAYFSRNRIQPKSPEDVDENFGYPWWILWPQFQKQILEFSQRYKYTVVTDVANYYDSIDFGQLRNYLSSLGHFSEILLDFLFFLLERFIWRPDYLPFSGKGLPQINLDTPRLVAHAFLFEIDRLLEESTNGDFVRWMDDINFGCDDKIAAKQLLGKIDDLLLSRGIHLNPSKTGILSSEEAFAHFQLRENRYLTIFQKRLTRLVQTFKNNCHPRIITMKKLLRRRYSAFVKAERVGQWDKVLKRYFTISTSLEDTFLEKDLKEYLYSMPGLRSSIFRYLISIGWTEARERMIVEYLNDAVDDDSFFNAIDVLLKWSPVSAVKYALHMKELAVRLSNNNNVQSFIGGLWLIAKYGNDQDILDFCQKTLLIWRSNEWLARQVAALWPRIKSQKIRETIMGVINSFGLTSARSVLDNYNIISSDEKLYLKTVRPYIYATMANEYYTLPKLLIALSIFQGTISDKVKEETKEQLLKIIKDPVLKFHIMKV
jgi:hypothetical protein